MRVSFLLRLDFLERYSGFAPMFIRLLVGVTLVHMSQDNVFGHARMLEFREFLAARGVVYPLVAAHVSVYAQFLSGLCILLGLFTRSAAAVMVINFIAALLIAHVGAPFEANVPPFAMLLGSAFLLLNGPGRVSLDRLWFVRSARDDLAIGRR